jgi:nucleotide-binding universal stress UspA family protein
MPHTVSERVVEIGRPELSARGLSGVVRRLLCAIDFSERSERTMRRALSLAHRLNADLTFLHVMAPDEIADRAAGALEQIANRVVSVAPRGSTEPAIELRSGDCVQAIARLADETDADLIVLGSRRRRDVAGLVGTTAERIIALARRPALVVNLDGSVPYRSVVIAAELSDAFVRVARVARLLRVLDGAAVSVLHGFESPYRGPLYAQGFELHAAQRNLDEWERAAKKRLLLKMDSAGVESSKFRLVFHQARPVGAIQRIVRSVQPELLIIGTKDRSMLNRIMQGGTSNDLLRTIECDLLVAAPGEIP